MAILRPDVVRDNINAFIHPFPFKLVSIPLP
jgi:hypothetical protein